LRKKGGNAVTEKGKQADGSMSEEYVEISRLWVGELGASEARPVKIHASPSAFFKQETLPYVWPEDEKHISYVDSGDNPQKFLRFAWCIVYLHHPDPKIIIETLRCPVLADPDDALRGVALFLPELLMHKDADVRAEAARVAWTCPEDCVEYIFTTLTSRGVIPSGFDPLKAKNAIELLRGTCPPDRKNLLLKYVPRTSAQGGQGSGVNFRGC